MAASDEQTSLLHNIYANETDPDAKSPAQELESVVEGVPLHPPAAPPAERAAWSTGLFACFGCNDEFFSSDLEVCVLGSFAPCLLYATNVERLHPSNDSSFANHCLAYTGLLCLGKFIFGWNALAPCLSFSSRSEMRSQYNIMGTGEWFSRSCGCCTSCVEGEHSEGCESGCDFATHYLCHQCALCQEGREIRRRMPHPGFFRAYTSMNAPTEQAMST